MSTSYAPSTIVFTLTNLILQQPDDEWVLLSQFYPWGNQGSEQLSDFLKVTQLLSDRWALVGVIDFAAYSSLLPPEGWTKRVTRATQPGICAKAVNLEGTKDLDNEFKSLARR